jgi:methionyl-tRNA formyltransferase
MKVAIITGSANGTASHHLPALAGSSCFSIAQVILTEGPAPRKRHAWRKLRKMLRIGPLGAIMGIRMRRWYAADVQAIRPIDDIHSVCERLGVPIATTPFIGHPRTLELLREADADIAVSLGNGYIPSKVFLAPRLGMLNIHHELLPERQNAQAVIWAIHDGSRTTGYTIHRIDKGIDTGAILLREEVPIRFKPTLGATVSHTLVGLLDASAAGLRRVLDHLPEHLAAARPQGAGNKRTTPTFAQFMRIVRKHRALATNR